MDFYDNDLLELNLHLGYGLDENCLSNNLNISCAIQAEFCVNEYGQFTYTNNAMCCLSEYSRQELLGMRLIDIDTSLASQNWDDIWNLLKKNGSTQLLSHYQTKTNLTVNVSVSICYVKQNLVEFACAFVSYTILHQSLKQPTLFLFV
ncbi:hypothetical protein RIVM261_017530 [Rivularia sp. IAM M-261]|nr:hypothetical protein CAL7716_030010 [Calothrix sp. PCC 7716]GJD16797.1 hypothetical protein RIVM261_017530 [Rivularia sp. IAM M-261]